MMKRCLLLVLIALLLYGCTGNVPETSEPVSVSAPSESVAPETVPSLYDPENPVQESTDGAVTGYLLDEDRCDLAFLGDQLLLFYNDTFGPTRLVLLDEAQYSPVCTAELAGIVYPGDKGVRVSGSAFGYYSEVEHAVIVLDSNLREVSQVEMPADVEGLPVIREDMKEAYYTAGTDIRAIDLRTGLSRLVRQRDCLSLTLEQAAMQDEILICRVAESENSEITEFISTESGATVGTDTGCVNILSWGDRYYLERMEGVVLERIFALDDGVQKVLLPRWESHIMRNALRHNALVAATYEEERGTLLQFYDLEAGKITAAVRLETLSGLYGITPDPAGKQLWFFGCDNAGEVALYRWDTTASPVTDQEQRVKLRHTADAPDAEAISLCRQKAKEMEQRFGVKIHLEKELQLTLDYAFTFEHHPSAFLMGLEQLEKTMSRFPEDFFEVLGKVSEDGKLHIGFVRAMQARTANSVTGAAGTQYWSDGNAWVTLQIGEHLQSSFCHELAHVLDTFILNEALAFDDWEQWNPKDFRYDENYVNFLKRENSPWLDGEKRAFVDSFAMSFPKEDRARIFECAMADGNQSLFASSTMQKKLTQVCKGIRDAFGWKKDQREFPWEQYLEKSLAKK